MRTVTGLSIFVSLTYLCWRLLFTLSGSTLWLSIPLVAMELWSFATFLLFVHSLWNLHAIPLATPVTKTRLRVAVLIPTFNEPREVLLPTVAAAVALEPAHTTWVLDDGHRPWVAELAADLGAEYRARTGHDGAKAGNINAALGELDADVIAVFDADHVALSAFLTHTLGYFDDPEVALVQTPQEFYNTASFEHVNSNRGLTYSEQELFYRGLAAGRNRWGAAFWCGTNAVVRVRALRSVGGVATETVTEDIHTTIRLHRDGWKTVYHNEVLARGLAAANAQQFLSQRLRWGTGAMQVLRIDNPAFIRKLSLHQRFAYLSTLLGWFDAWRTLGLILLPIATVATGGLPIRAPLVEFLCFFVASLVLQRVAVSLITRGFAPLWPSTVFDFVRMPANLRSTLVVFSGQPRPFSVTPKGRVEQDRSRMPVPWLIKLLIVASVVGAGWYAATVLGLTPIAYPIPWVAHGAMVWLLVNLAVLLAAARRIRNEAFGSDRRAAVRFRMGGHVAIDGARATVSDGSLTGLRVHTDRPLDVGQLVQVSMGPRDEGLDLDAVVRACRPIDSGQFTVGLEFHELEHQASARLALDLFATGITPDLMDQPDS